MKSTFENIHLAVNTHNSIVGISRVLSELPESYIYIAGGAIRNLYNKDNSLGKDIDLFINDIKDQDLYKYFIKYLSKSGKIILGQYGSPRYFPYKSNDLYFDIVPFTNFNVGFPIATDIDSLLMQFDFTANAVAYDLVSHTIVNPLHGLEDINNQVLRAVRLDFPEGLVSEEIILSRLSVLWFRLVHYWSILGYQIDSLTRQWIKINIHRLEDLEKFKLWFFEPSLTKLIDLK